MTPESRARALFAETWPGTEPTVIASAPGRVNLIGEHIDYAGGWVFPAAISLRTVVAAAPSPDGVCRVGSEQFPTLGEFPLDELQEFPGAKPWWIHGAGVGWEMAARTPIHAAIASDIPFGSGLSSSAAIELAFAAAWRELEGRAEDNEALARISRQAEHRHAGVPCGLMDQAAIALGRAGMAMLMDMSHPEEPPLPVEHRSLPTGLSIVVCHTGAQRRNDDGVYADRFAASQRIIAALGPLREASMEDINQLSAADQPRARHFISEMRRCLDFAEALAQSDFESIGRLMAESHASLRDDFEVSMPALDSMAEIAARQPGCVGARLTGAGGGGACVALVKEQFVTEFCRRVLEEARSAHPENVQSVIPCEAADGVWAAPAKPK